jgi:hypothetical protein
MHWTAIRLLTLALASSVACSESSLPIQPTHLVGAWECHTLPERRAGLARVQAACSGV